jgi:cold shock CspA family protein
MPAETQIGRVTFAARNIGWISRGFGSSVFFHLSQVIGDPPVTGDRVSFVAIRGKRGKWKAENVRVIER